MYSLVSHQVSCNSYSPPFAAVHTILEDGARRACFAVICKCYAEINAAKCTKMTGIIVIATLRGVINSGHKWPAEFKRVCMYIYLEPKIPLSIDIVRLRSYGAPFLVTREIQLKFVLYNFA